MNEFNANISGNTYYAALLDKTVKAGLQYWKVSNSEVLSSSIISADRYNYLDWFWQYYGNGGVGAPNIHLYADSTLDGGSFANTIARFERVVGTVKAYANASHRVVIGEIGFPRAGLGLANSAQNHSQFMKTVLNDPIISSADRIVFWRLLSDWLNVPGTKVCTDTSCGAVTAQETTFGYVNYLTNTPESQMSQFFLPYGFWWSH